MSQNDTRNHSVQSRQSTDTELERQEDDEIFNIREKLLSQSHDQDGIGRKVSNMGN